MTSGRTGMGLLLLLLLLPGCGSLGPFGTYTSDLVNPDTGRSPVVTWPAKFGFGVGFVGGLPITLAGSPVTYTVYKVTSPPDESYLFSFLQPSLVTGMVGTCVLGAPFDLLEFVAYRWWSGGEGESEPDQRPE